MYEVTKVVRFHVLQASTNWSINSICGRAKTRSCKGFIYLLCFMYNRGVEIFFSKPEGLDLASGLAEAYLCLRGQFGWFS